MNKAAIVTVLLIVLILLSFVTSIIFRLSINTIASSTPTDSSIHFFWTPSFEKIRLTVINYSGYDVYIKLEGSMTGNVAYLRIYPGSPNYPQIQVFTILKDWYKNTMYQCDGIESVGVLIADGKMRLPIPPCKNTIP